jgi:hypothetical protein
MEKFLQKHPNRVPVYVHVDEKRLYMEKNKYLVPHELTVAEFTRIIRKRTSVKAHEAMFMFVDDNVLPPNSITFGELYRQHADSNKLLHVTYNLENTFGGWL